MRSRATVQSPTAHWRNTSRAAVGEKLFPATEAESDLLITPANFTVPSHDACGYVHVLRYGSNAVPGTTDMLAAIQAAIAVAQSINGELWIPEGVYGISDGIVIVNKIQFSMAEGSLLQALASYPDPADIEDGTWMITADHADVAGSSFSNVNLNGLSLALGLYVGQGSRVQVSRGHVSNCRGSAVYLDQCSDSTIDKVIAESCGIDPALSGSAYTTAIRAQGVFGDRAENVTISRCTVRSSGGKSIAMAYCDNSRIIDNFAKGWTDSYGTGLYTASCANVRIARNTAIQLAGSAATSCLKLSNDSDNCSVEDNVLEMNTDMDIVHVQNSTGVRITRNRFLKTVATVSNRQHVKISDDGVAAPSSYLTITDNDFRGHGNTNTTAVATPADVSNVTVTNNRFRAFAMGVQVAGANPIVHSNSYDDVTLPEQLGGASNPRADYSKMILRTTSDQSAIGPGAGTLSVTLPASTMDRTRSIRVRGSGTKTGSAGNKTISFRFGSTDFVFNAAANDTQDWFFDVVVSNVSETSQRVSGVGYNGATALPIVGTAAEDTQLALTIGVRANPAAADTITMKMLTVELLP